MAKVFPLPGRLRALFSGLRMRLTLGFVGFFSVLMLAAGFFFRDSMSGIMRHHASEHLIEEWNSARVALRVVEGKPVWSFDTADPEGMRALERLRNGILLADREGRVIEISPAYAAIGGEPPELIRQLLAAPRPEFRQRKSPAGEDWQFRSGRISLGGEDYFLSIGVPITGTDEVLDRPVRTYFLGLPVMLLLVSAVGWFLAGKALQPFIEVADAARYVSGDNLKLRIQAPGTNDELDLLVQRFNEMMDRLETNFAQMRQFAIHASHELRTPVTAIRGQLEVALLHARDVEGYRVAVETAMQDVERLSQIVKTLQLLSEADANELPSSRTVNDLQAIVAAVVENYHFAAADRGVTLQISSSGPCPAMVDRLQMERLVSNLISNAINCSPAGGAVTVAVQRRDVWVDVTVADQGPGIAQHHLDHLFQPFYRVRDGDRDEEKGLGLGLPVALWAARAHGGTILVNTAPGQGSTFTARLPVGLPGGALPPRVAKQPEAAV